MLARAINGSGHFRDLGGSLIIVFLHRLLAWTLYRSPALCALIKGKPVVLVRDGAYQTKEMRAQLISEEDFEEDMRLEAKTEERCSQGRAPGAER